MADGFIYWYEVGWSARRAAARIAGFEAAGWSVSHLVNGNITEVTLDGDVVIDQAQLLRGVGLDHVTEFHFKYWYDSEDGDIYCRIRRVAGDLVVQEFGIDGFTMAERDAIAVDVLAAAVAAGESTRGIVVDRLGYAEDIDWDAVVLGTEPVTIVPDLLGLIGPAAHAARRRLLHCPHRQAGALALFDPDEPYVTAGPR